MCKKNSEKQNLVEELSRINSERKNQQHLKKKQREGEREIRTTAKKELAGGKPTIATPPAPPL